MRVWIEFEEVTTRRVLVNVTDSHVAREIWENDESPHIREGWVDESVEWDSRVDWDSASYLPEYKEE